VKGLFFYLYLMIDLYSRTIVGGEVYACESAAYAAEVVRRAVLVEQCRDQPVVRHADNGSPMKGSALLETLYRLGVVTSYSRPRVSNDNPFSEAVFRTCKYRPEYPEHGFASLEAARAWILQFVTWYNHDHRHSRIRFVTPHERHSGQEAAIIAQREAVYEQAKARHPERWQGAIRNWKPVTEVWLNPAAEVLDKVPGLPQTE
jgi:transposase InsO family protein